MSNDLRFLRLMDEVERQGGAHLPGACTGKQITYTKRTAYHAGIKVDYEKVDPIKTAACNREQRFSVPDLLYAGETFEPKQTVACFTDDGMAYWPRFARAVSEDSE